MHVKNEGKQKKEKIITNEKVLKEKHHGKAKNRKEGRRRCWGEEGVVMILWCKSKGWWKAWSIRKRW